MYYYCCQCSTFFSSLANRNLQIGMCNQQTRIFVGLGLSKVEAGEREEVLSTGSRGEKSEGSALAHASLFCPFLECCIILLSTQHFHFPISSLADVVLSLVQHTHRLVLLLSILSSQEGSDICETGLFGVSMQIEKLPRGIQGTLWKLGFGCFCSRLICICRLIPVQSDLIQCFCFLLLEL